MTIALNWSRTSDDVGFFTYSQSVTGTAEPIAMGPGMSRISVAIHPAATFTARVEFTLSPRAAVDAGTARWISWDLGNVAAPAADALLSTITAIRGVSSGGTATLELRAS